MKRIITQIPQFNVDLYQPKRVAAYARVSSDKDMAIHSLNTQVDYYSDYIRSNPSWTFSGIYIDEGISGTKENRTGFKEMMAACRAHELDMIVTKSISRFARNTVTLLRVIRELNALGIDVYFEKENIHSLSSDGELMLTVLAVFAEEEARSASENQRWRIKHMFEAGIPTYQRMLGYRSVGDTLVIVPDEAEIVKKIYQYYLDGMGYQRIIRKLESEGIRTILGNKFGPTYIHNILTQEKYCGDLLLQKTYVVDFLTKKKIVNRGEYPSYYVKNAHEPIIDRETWNKVQKEIKSRHDKTHPNSLRGCRQKNYLFTGIIVCKYCGSHLVHKTRSGKSFWMCREYQFHGKAACPNSGIPEDILIGKTIEAINIISSNPIKKLTKEIIESELKLITISEDKKIIFKFKDGSNYLANWDYPSRKFSWTDDMKQLAREKALKQYREVRT